MATRMQQRRGTAAQWISTNSGNGPILNAGEIGFETDTNKFKIGDGTNHWVNLDYFIDANSTVNPSFGSSITFEGATANDFETTLTITDPTADRTITFPDATGTVALTSDISELSQDAVDAALTAGTGITKTYNDGANTLTLAVDTTTIQARVTDVSDTEIGYLNGVTSAIQTQLNNKAPLESPTFTGTVTLPANTISQSMMSDDSVGTNEIGGLAVTEGKIADGAVTNVKVSASAAIAQSKIADLTTDLAAKLPLAGGTMTGAIAMGTNKITGLGTPTDSTDAATKAYVDAVTEGLHIHAAAIAATTENITLASALENGDTLDGITLATGDRILVKNQTTTSENGIYVVQASGQPTRAADFDSAAEVDSGDFIFVSSGTVNGSTGWVQTNKPATIGTDPILFTQFAGAGTYTAGTGITLTGTVFSINTGTTVDLNTAQTLTNKTLTSPKINEDVAVTSTATELNILDGATLSTTELNYVDGVTSAIQTQLDAKIAKADITAKGAILVGTGSGTYAAQSVGTNGQVLTANSAQADGVEWTTIAGYSAPTLGSTSIASGATVTTIAGLTLTAPTLTGTVTASGDINLSTANGPGSVVDEFALLLMGAL
jgi:hypothetical protein